MNTILQSNEANITLDVIPWSLRSPNWLREFLTPISNLERLKFFFVLFFPSISHKTSRSLIKIEITSVLKLANMQKVYKIY